MNHYFKYSFPQTSHNQYPYGKVLREFNEATDTRYLTTHHERDKETGFDYRGARFYDSDLGRFLSLDPLAAKYPNYSPYNYVAGNPNVFIDPDGRSFIMYYKKNVTVNGKTSKVRYKVTFDGNKIVEQQKINKGWAQPTDYVSGSNDFVDNVMTAYNYIVGSNADVDGVMQKMASSERELKITNRKNAGMYMGNGEIAYDFSKGLEIKSEDFKKTLGSQSSALGFWSEVYHAYLDYFSEEYDNDLDAEEEFIHGDREKKVIQKLKEFDQNNNETPRNKYEQGFKLIPVNAPTHTPILK